MSSLRGIPLAWWPAGLWAGVIFVFSAIPDLRLAEADAVDFVVRKLGHMAVFGVLALLIWRPLSRGSRGVAFALSLALTAAYATVDEFHQSFTNGRHASAMDVGIDSVGALIALLALCAWLWLRARRAA